MLTAEQIERVIAILERIAARLEADPQPNVVQYQNYPQPNPSPTISSP